MNPHERLIHIYDAATSAQNWTRALDHCGEAGGAKGVALFASNNHSFEFQLAATNSFYPNNSKLVAEYLDRFRRYDEYSVNFVFNKPTLQRVEDTEIWPNFEEQRDREDLAYLLKKFGVFRRSAYNLARTKAWTAVIGFHYDQSVSEPTLVWKEHSDILMPHLSKVIEINRFCAQLRQRYQAVLTVLDHIDVALCAVLPSGEVLVQNRRAQQIFDATDGITLTRSNHFLLRDEEITAAVKSFIEECSATAVGEATHVERIVKAPKRSLGDPYLIEISPLRDGDNELNEKLAGALMLIVDPQNPPKLSVDALVKLHDLTKAESEVVDNLLEGRTLPEIAEIRSVSVETVRNQAKAIYLKLDVHNRAELIRKIANLSPPVVIT